MQLPTYVARPRRAAALLGLVALLAGLLPVLAAPANAAPAFYRTELRDGRWWYVGPGGGVSFSIGLNYVNPSGMTARDGTNPYRAVMEAKYGAPVDQAAWARDAGARLAAWGFNTVGAFSAGARGRLAGLPDTPQLYPLHQGVIPAMRRANGGGDAYPIMEVSPNDGWDFHRLFVDVYHPTFATEAERYFAAQLPARAADPTLIGYFLDNELPFYYRHPGDLLAASAGTAGALTLADSYIALGPAAAGKQRWVALLRERYPHVDALNAAWGTDYPSFDALLGVDAVPGAGEAQLADKSAFLADIAETYFRTYRDAFRRHDPNHLILGCRFVVLDGIDTPGEVLAAAGRHQDVVSINYYLFNTRHETYDQRRARMRSRFAHIVAASGRPLTIGEFSFAARDSGLPNRVVLGELVDTQSQRAALYADYVRIAAETPQVVGAAWFGYIDPPGIGAMNGGEDGNYGLVNNADVPYAAMVQGLAAINPQLTAIHAAAPVERLAPPRAVPPPPLGTPARLALTAGAGGTAAVATPGPYAPGTVVTLNAAPALGHRFAGWTIDGVPGGAANPVNLTMDGDHTVVANFAPVRTLGLTSTTGGGAAASPDRGPYDDGSVVRLVAAPAPGHIFVGWTVDGAFRGWENPVPLVMGANHTVVASFAPRPAYPDVAAGNPAREAIQQLAARGIIRGYGDGRFGPSDTTLRAQMAALIARAMGWDAEDWGNDFTDGAGIDPALWRNVGTLAHRGVAYGYGDGRFGPNDRVTRAQTISFITRAMIEKGYWQPQPDNPAVYPAVPASSGHRVDIATFTHYAGALPGTGGTGGAFDWGAPATRGWFSQALWLALDRHWRIGPLP
jgi:agarase